MPTRCCRAAGGASLVHLLKPLSLTPFLFPMISSPYTFLLPHSFPLSITTHPSSLFIVVSVTAEPNLPRHLPTSICTHFIIHYAYLYTRDNLYDSLCALQWLGAVVAAPLGLFCLLNEVQENHIKEARESKLETRIRNAYKSPIFTLNYISYTPITLL